MIEYFFLFRNAIFMELYILYFMNLIKNNNMKYTHNAYNRFLPPMNRFGKLSEVMLSWVERVKQGGEEESVKEKIYEVQVDGRISRGCPKWR